MFKIIVEKECSCFKDSDLINGIELASKDEALIKSLDMKNHMNEEFCGKHEFQVQESGKNFVISFNQPVSSGCGCGSNGGGCGSH
jgi:hypothetical protein